ncbi:variable surface lipoprotein [Mycoplasmopsis arginini]|uniref:variable surface lipoprotein n=1 Tax=Mycoplasmopsis arginini TaxID=2094 RepID=UPI0027359F8C|nr:variable surface lipoprotein [Mycoplasmopsis arginini]MDP4043111.1 variable surface lipoprotein [Mycoplasmopsis arginini]
MKRASKILSIGSLVSLSLPLLAISCNNSKPQIDNSGDSSGSDWINPNINNWNRLSSSQLAEVKDSFSYTLTAEGKKLSRDELEQVIKEIRKNCYPGDSGVISSALTAEKTFSDVKKHPKFKKYFSFTTAFDKNFSYLGGHKLEMEFMVRGDDKDLPAIKYVLRCPDKIYQGKMAVEATEFVYLEID